MSIKFPIGGLRANFSERGLQSLEFLEQGIELDSESTGLSMLEEELQRQLVSYFKGTLKEFTVPLDPKGTEFQRSIWKWLQDIPYGKTISYQDLANIYGDPKAIRAIAAANGANPIPILIPCHRVIGADGSLTGYSGGLWRKEFLLDLESGVKRLF